MARSKQVVLVTGASSGIGEATARHLIATGHTVYGAARRVERMSGLADLGARALSLDVTDNTADAIEADRPKTRYLASDQARLAVTARWLLPDRVFDALIRSRMT